MEQNDNEFCTRQFRPAIAVMVALVIAIVGWTLWRVRTGTVVARTPVALAAAKTPAAPPININTKMLHADWGNCNKCHITTGKPKSSARIMSGPPIAIAQSATHPYWGNCLLCHKVLDGFQPNGAWAGTTQAQAAALTTIGPTSQAQLQAHPFVPSPGMQAVGVQAPGLLIVAASSPSLSAAVAPLFDTGAYFVLIDPQRQVYRIEDNPNAGVAGYGVPTAQLMANLRATGVVAGGFSPAALAMLGSLRIAAYPGVAGTVQDALSAYRTGGLSPAQVVFPVQAPLGPQARF